MKDIDLNSLSNAERAVVVIGWIREGIELWRKVRADALPDDVVVLDKHNRALHRNSAGQSVVCLLTPQSAHNVRRFGPGVYANGYRFKGDLGTEVLMPKRLIDFIDEEIAGAEASIRSLEEGALG